MATVHSLPRRRVPWPTYPSLPVRFWLPAAAAALCLLIGGYGLGYWQASRNHPSALGSTLPGQPTLALARLGEDHREYLAVREPAQIPGPDIVPVSRSLTSLVKFPVAAIDLRAQGARLLGGRKCQLQGIRIAFLLYDWKGERVSLYQLNGRQVVLPALHSTAFDGRCFLVGEAEDLSYVAWHSGSREFIMVSGAHSERLLMLARFASCEPTF
jgi:anti-sigma factor RsiW